LHNAGGQDPDEQTDERIGGGGHQDFRKTASKEFETLAYSFDSEKEQIQQTQKFRDNASIFVPLHEVIARSV